MKLKEKFSVNVGAATLYVEIYHRHDENTGEVITEGWKIGDMTWECFPESNNVIKEFVYTGDSENNGWVTTVPSFFTSICSNFFSDIHEASNYVVRILNNDPMFDEVEYLNREKERVKAIN